MGGIYELWKNPLTGEPVKTFSLITTGANPFTSQIHSGGKNPFRMPHDKTIIEEKNTGLFPLRN